MGVLRDASFRLAVTLCAMWEATWIVWPLLDEAAIEMRSLSMSLVPSVKEAAETSSMVEAAMIRLTSLLMSFRVISSRELASLAESKSPFRNPRWVLPPFSLRWPMSWFARPRIKWLRMKVVPWSCYRYWLGLFLFDFGPPCLVFETTFEHFDPFEPPALFELLLLGMARVRLGQTWRASQHWRGERVVNLFKVVFKFLYLNLKGQFKDTASRSNSSPSLQSQSSS